LCTMYRQMQILHASMADISSQFLTTLFPVGVAGLIITFYVAIKHFEHTIIFITIGECEMGVSILIMLQFSIRLCTRITSLSAEYGELKFINDAHLNYSRFFKSCRPFYWKIGPYTYSRSTFLHLVSHVIASVINLLMLSK
jgi:hypothetical protein